MTIFDVPGLHIVDEDWKQTIVRRLLQGKVLPVISDVVCHDLVFGSHHDLIHGLARSIGYPLDDAHNLPRMAQFHSVMLQAEAGADHLRIKELYLAFLQAVLYRNADANLLADLQQDVHEVGMTLTQKADRLNCPPQDSVHLFSRLASFRLPIYLTTSYHTFLELALAQEGATPRSEICYWHDELRRIPSVFDGRSLLAPEEPYVPSPDEPLVYHLHGIDTDPGTLVLTEDDHLNFMAALLKDKEIVPLRVRQALADSSLILLGYDLRNWDFRVAFRGLIKPGSSERRVKSVSIQLSPDNKYEKAYLTYYLAQEAEFEVYWGQVGEFIEDLWAVWSA